MNEMNTTGPNAIEVRHLNFFYGKFQGLRNIHLDIAEKKVTAFIGPSGCGKSTLLRIASGLETASEGRVTINTDRIGYVFQDATLLAWRDVQALAFGQGPGAFTGLRTACATVQGLALGLERPVIAIDTLMAVVEDARQAGSVSLDAPIWALQDARMGELYAARYRWADGHWAVDQAAQLWPLAHPLGQGLQAAPAQWAGHAVQADPDTLAPLLDTRCSGTGEDGVAAPRGAALIALARAAWARGDTLDAALALPRYVRDKVAQTTAERQAARA